MRILILVITSLIFNGSLVAQEFYYYQNEKLYLEQNKDFISVQTTFNARAELQALLGANGKVTSFQADNYPERLKGPFRNTKSPDPAKKYYFAEIELAEVVKTKDGTNRLMQQLKLNEKITHIAHYYSSGSQPRFSVHDKIWVRLNDSSQITLLKDEAEKLDYFVLGQHPFMPDWYLLQAANKDALHPFKVCQQLVESKQFACVEPDMYHAAITTCVNDPLFTTQWALTNTNGINACNAWGLSTGTGTKIAILDEGFENNHPDLSANVINSGYDAIFGSSPTLVYGPHGTACAGIAAAKSNNAVGIAGVAPDAQLMSVSVLFSNSAGIQGNTTSAQFADAILWPMNQGADVISNSWGTGSSALITAALFTVLTNGRNGKGCVIVFATGNDSLSNIAYPANAFPGIIAVGNVMSNGTRRFSSNYGAGLDVMAPGTTIATTDQQGGMGYDTSSSLAGNYTNNFNGTSAACPHVAGLAALILSANPCLTNTQVSQIINRSAQKIFGYLYNINGPDGSWNNETGYGLIDAQAAVEMAQSLYLQNLTNTTIQNYKYPNIRAGYQVDVFNAFGNYVTSSSAQVNIEAKNFIDFQVGCDLQGTVDAHLSNTFGNCTTW